MKAIIGFVVAVLALWPVLATAAECDEYPLKLKDCTPYACVFQHPLTHQNMGKRIMGEVNGLCKTIEQMPNNGHMDCAYTQPTRQAVAQFELQKRSAKSFSSSADWDGEHTKTEYRLNGAVVENPNQKAYDSGQCEIVGY